MKKTLFSVWGSQTSSILRGRYQKQMVLSDWLICTRHYLPFFFLLLTPYCFPLRTFSVCSSCGIFECMWVDAVCFTLWIFFFWGLSFWVFTYVTRKMTHFNKGPSYGLSAEVRSKVSACKGGLGSAGLKSLQTFNLTDSNSLFWFLNKFPSTVSFAFSSFFSLRHTTQWRGWGCPNFTKASISNFPFAHSLLGIRRTIL